MNNPFFPGEYIWNMERIEMRGKKRINFKALILGIAVSTVIVIVVTIELLIEFIFLNYADFICNLDGNFF